MVSVGGFLCQPVRLSGDYGNQIIGYVVVGERVFRADKAGDVPEGKPVRRVVGSVKSWRRSKRGIIRKVPTAF